MTRRAIRNPPISEICEVCGERASTRRLERESKIMIWTGDLCDECYARELGPVTAEDAAHFAALATSGSADEIRREADDLLRRAMVHQHALLEELRILIEKHTSQPPA